MPSTLLVDIAIQHYYMVYILTTTNRRKPHWNKDQELCHLLNFFKSCNSWYWSWESLLDSFCSSTSRFTPIHVMMLLFALHQPAFIEEFFFRGIILGKLERALGQNKAWFYSGILFGLVHITTNFCVTGLDWFSGIFMLAEQIIAGCIYGIIYMKTRNLLHGMVCYYLTDGRMASIISMMFG